MCPHCVCALVQLYPVCFCHFQNIIKSPNLIETLCERIDFLDFTEQHQMVLRTFLKRSEMERNKRSETPLQEEMERILGRERRQEFSETDPLFDLFMKPSSEENG